MSHPVPVAIIFAAVGNLVFWGIGWYLPAKLGGYGLSAGGLVAPTLVMIGLAAMLVAGIVAFVLECREREP